MCIRDRATVTSAKEWIRRGFEPDFNTIINLAKVINETVEFKLNMTNHRYGNINKQ